MRLITVRRKYAEGDVFPLYLWSDWHRLNSNCCKKSLLADRAEIAANPLAMYATLGDLEECIGHRDKRYEASHIDWSLLEPQDMDRLADVAVADRVAFEEPVIEKCIASTDGNHDLRFNVEHHTDINARSLEKMGRPELAVRGACLVRIVFENPWGKACTVVLNLHHGRRVAKHKSTLLNNLLIKLRHWDGVDILARGHCHFTGAASEARVTFDKNFTQLKDKQVFAALSGGYLKTYLEDGTCYAEDFDLDPIDIGMQRFLITPTRSGATIEAVTK